MHLKKAIPIYIRRRIAISVLIIFSAISIIISGAAAFSGIGPDADGSTLLYAAGRLMGMLGFLCLSLLIFSGETARFFDRFFGMDRIIKFQRMFSAITGLIVVSHPILFIISDISFARFLVPGATTTAISAGAVSLYVMLMVLIASKFYKRISHKAWQFIHIAIYALFFMSFYHMTQGTAFITSPGFMIMGYATLSAILIGIIYRTTRKLMGFFGPRHHVEAIRKETDNTFSMLVKPDRGKMNFKAGQFCFLRIDKNKLHARHPFTIASSPKDAHLQFTIKRDGRFTRTAEKMKAGEEVAVDGPYGQFFIEEHEKDLVFIAGGVGITPFRSMIKQMADLGTDKKVALLYCCRRKEDIIFKSFFDSIDEPWFKKTYVLSRGDTEDSEDYKKGHINKDIIRESIIDFRSPTFYICGSESLKRDVVEMLAELGVEKNSIKIEDFFW